MSLENSKFTERSAVLAIVPPLAATDTRVSSYVLPSLFQSLGITVLNGDVSASGTLTLIKAANSTGGSSASVATVAFGGTGSVADNWVTRITVLPSDMCDEVRPYFAISVGGGPALTAAIIEGFDPRYAPPTSIANVTDGR